MHQDQEKISGNSARFLKCVWLFFWDYAKNGLIVTYSSDLDVWLSCFHVIFSHNLSLHINVSILWEVRVACMLQFAVKWISTFPSIYVHTK